MKHGHVDISEGGAVKPLDDGFLGRVWVGWEVGCAGPGSCPESGFGICGAEAFVSAGKERVSWVKLPSDLSCLELFY